MPSVMWSGEILAAVWSAIVKVLSAIAMRAVVLRVLFMVVVWWATTIVIPAKTEAVC